MFLGGNYLESVGITGNLLYYTQGSVLLTVGWQGGGGGQSVTAWVTTKDIIIT